MSAGEPSELRPWSLSRWCGLIVLAFGVQVGLICWLNDRTPLRPRAQSPVPVLRPAGALAPEFLARTDPTWFTLPHAQGFSGRAWLQGPSPEPHAFNWTSPPAWLRLAQEQPGAAFYAVVRSNDLGATLPAATPELVLTLPEVVPVPLSRERSELRREGGLAQRALVTPVELASQQSTGLLTNTVVQAVVDAKGWPQTLTLLQGSGSAEVDAQALKLATVARFAPLPGGARTSKAAPAPLTEGLLVFQWHTLLVPSTNAAASPSL
jgi:hypothetical protein